MPRKLSFVRMRGRRGAQTGLVDVVGPIERVLAPAPGKPFKGWAVVKIAGKTVTGPMPFLDSHFVYRLRCRRSTHEKYGSQFEIAGYGVPAFEPRPITCITLHDILVHRYKWDDWSALDVVRDAKDALFVTNLTDPLDLNIVCRTRHLPWLQRLQEDMLLLAYPCLVDLPLVWPEATLARYSTERLFEIARTLAADPFAFCLPWLNDFHLPPVPVSKLPQLERAARRPLSQKKRNLVHCYSHLRAWLRNRGQLCFDSDALPGYMLEPGACAYAIKKQLFKPKYERTESGGTRRYYLVDTFQQLSVLHDRLAQIMASTDEPPLRATQPQAGRLNCAQLDAYDAVMSQPLLIILGDAGTGKTLVGSMISRRFKSRAVLPLACFGRMAANMRGKYGRGMTVAKVLHSIRCGTKEGQQLVANTQVVIIDEISTLTLELLVPLLTQLEHLSRIVLMGDEKQTPPVGAAGDIVAALIERYEGTSVLHRLTEIRRIESNPEYEGVLLKAVKRVKQRRIDIDYYWGLDTAHPFVVLQRADVSRMAGDAERLAAVTKDMRKVLKHHSIEEIQVITQTNETRMLLNRALYSLTQRATGGYREGTYSVGEKILFTENYYPDGSGFKQTRCSEVMNGEVCEIVGIEDVEPCDPDKQEPGCIAVESTSERKQNPAWPRIVKLRGGKRVNLDIYDISKIAKGYAVTIYMYQGSEAPVVVVYIHEGVSDTFNWREFYTAVTRAQRRVIVFTRWGDHGDLRGTDMHRVMLTDCPQGESFVHNWLPEVTPFGVLVE